MQTKLCKTCQEIKPIEAFGVRKDVKGGTFSDCRLCAAARARAHREARIERDGGKHNLNAYQRAYAQTDSGKDATRRAKAKHLGVREDDLDTVVASFKSHSGLCDICQTLTTARGLHIDHDHASGKFRGLLCGHCNSMLGFAKDDTAVLTAGIRYLQMNAERQLSVAA